THSLPHHSRLHPFRDCHIHPRWHKALKAFWIDHNSETVQTNRASKVLIYFS
ncbi:hypothetical protein WG66_006487, partial [Moniliophthora roreri]